MEWSIQDLGAIGEIVGAIGVMVSLIYLGTQIRFSAKSTNAENFRELVAGLRDVVLRRDRFGVWVEKWIAGDRSKAVELELKIELRLVFDHYEAIWNAIRSGSIDPSIAKALVHRWLGFTFSWSMLRDLWKTMEGEYGADFVAYINEYMNSNPTTFSKTEQWEFIRAMNDNRIGTPSLMEPD